MATGSVNAAMIFIFPPHAGHSVTLRYTRPKVGLLRPGIDAENPCKQAGPEEAIDRLG